MPRAYRPKNETRQLVRDILALDGVAKVDILAPHRGVHPTPARIKVTLSLRHQCEDHISSAPPCEPASTVFTLSEAREWLAIEESKA